MGYYARVTVDPPAGGGSTIVYETDEGDAPGYGLADPLVIGWRIPDSVQRPAQPEPVTGRFSLYVSTAQTQRITVGMDTEMVVSVNGAVPAGGGLHDDWDIRLCGRIAGGSAVPYRAGMLYTFDVVDYTVDLADMTVGATPWDEQPLSQRVAAILTAAGVDSDYDVLATDQTQWWDGFNPYSVWYPRVTARDVDAASPLQMIVSTLDSYAHRMPETGPSGGGLARIIVGVSDVSIASGAAGGVVLEAVGERHRPKVQSAGYPSAPMPGVFANLTGGWGVSIPPNPFGGAIDACYVDFDAMWAVTKVDRITNARVLYLESNVTPPVEPYMVSVTVSEARAFGTPAVTATRETEINAGSTGADPHTTAAESAADVGSLMIPVESPSNGWAPDAFTWALSEDTAALAAFPYLFPSPHLSIGVGMRVACYTRPIVVTGIPDAQNPANAHGWFAGQLADVTYTLAGGKQRVDFRLTPTIARPAGDDAWSWDQLGAAHPTVTWNQLNPDYTWTDYRLIGS